MSIYDFSVNNAKGESQSLEQHKGNVLLIVNTASKCGFTPQYAELQTLHEQYHNQGLVILAFPCDQFAHQEPGSDSEIQQFCQINYGLTFPVLAKIEVNGNERSPSISVSSLTEEIPIGRILSSGISPNSWLVAMVKQLNGLNPM